MRIARLNETYITDTESHLAGRFASLSGGAIAEPYRLERGAMALAYDLDLDRPRPVTPSQLPAALVLALIEEDPDPPSRWTEWLAAATTGGSDEVVRFAEYLSYAEVIPFEASPVDLRSLASIATTASPLGIGAAMAFAVFGSSPLLLVGVPAGMIVCGAAAGLSRALDEGLRHRMLGFLTQRPSDEIELEEALIDARRDEDAVRAAQERSKDASSEQAPSSQQKPTTRSTQEETHVIGAQEKGADQAAQPRQQTSGS